MSRAVIGIVVGFAVWSILWLLSNTAVQAAAPSAMPAEGPIDSAGVLMLVLAISVVVSITSGYVAALIARQTAAGTCVVLGLVLLAGGIAVQIQYWDRMPVWYHLSFLALLLPATVLGGRLRSTSRAGQPAPGSVTAQA